MAGAFPAVVRAAGEHVREQVGGYEVEGGLEQAEALGAVPQLIEDVQSALMTMADRMADGPFSAAAREMLHEVGARIGGVQDYAREAHQRFEQDHDVELRRLREPRVNEHQWDTGAAGNQQ